MPLLSSPASSCPSPMPDQPTLVYQVAAIVTHIATVNSSTTASLSASPGGVLVDYHIFTQAYNLSWQLQQ